ncbi:JlpA-like lipoprotein [Campylobacter hepaticus]|uniref:Surface exposed lipoprotein JlpA n=1 Tax=Campylobacter hepaticus TaxID=1813019 RepID=A0A6A7JTZ3_9BACT|nr:JlpA family lipoprotein adhesin [Campylobacter hepaticus]AXP08513.1 hypothetical protein A2J15_002015 [Campylobacter hepaticus]MCZ0772349.1 JlpA-like lipoprotein [Campylobacter hepaticus]MCZ0773817.1 JlpA-like lipoprotein [Campylobacter hepaticus]MCZ0775068.1 JlpA-like lipoprotein [Campylobacter hepaticus]MDX2322937.1 JlpA family lipoprotein adhesin [Campylobacter hepaticus]
MKKNIILLICFAILFSACENSINKTTVEKYQTQLNKNLAEKLLNISQNPQIKIQLSDFSCKANEDFIECISPDFKILIKNNNHYEELFKVKNLHLQTNEIYKEQNNKLINIKQYYEYFFNKQKNIQTKLSFENFQLGAKLIDDINAILWQKDPKINSFIEKLTSDSYTLSFENQIKKRENDYLDNLKIILNNTRFNLNIALNINLKKDLLNYLESKGIQFNTQTLTMDQKAINEFFKANHLEKDNIQQYIVLNDFKINAKLQTQGIFSHLIKTSKENLQNLRMQSQYEEQALILDKILNILNDISKDDEYKFYLDLKFKNIALSDYNLETINSIEKLSINNQDLTELLKSVLPFLMFSTLFHDVQF